MPELPEVETIRRYLEPRLTSQRIDGVIIRHTGLRWPLSPTLSRNLAGQIIQTVERRAKYLLLRCGDGTLILHLGMTGRILVVPATTPALKHDHLDLRLGDGNCLRFNDSRRFGCAVWTTRDPLRHPLLANLGMEPLGLDLTGDYLHRRAKDRSVAVKNFIMNQRILVGVGNIYASEALHVAGIHPARPAGGISRSRYGRLASAIRQVLDQALQAGGTTLRDYRQGDGNPGGFQVQLSVYGRTGEPCGTCGRPVQQMRIGQRSTYLCPKCQR
jgi:formamidopyrimidine-DNA glycosylase